MLQTIHNFKLSGYGFSIYMHWEVLGVEFPNSLYLFIYLFSF